MPEGDIDVFSCFYTAKDQIDLNENWSRINSCQQLATPPLGGSICNLKPAEHL